MIDVLDQRNQQRVDELSNQLRGNESTIPKKVRESLVQLDSSIDSFDERVEELRKISLNNKIDIEFFNSTFDSLLNP